jgi:hypothetical protein
MPPPTPQQVKVATDALRKEAAVWDTESAELGKIGPKAEHLRFNRIEAGLFQVIIGTYGDLINQVIARSNEGTAQMTEIGKTLRDVADTYDREDASNEHKLKNVY